VGIRVIFTEEAYTSQAGFLDRDPLPTYHPREAQEEEAHPRFSGTRSGCWYQVKASAAARGCHWQRQHWQNSFPDSV
jgi:hypothetical protein